MSIVPNIHNIPFSIMTLQIWHQKYCICCGQNYKRIIFFTVNHSCNIYCISSIRCCCPIMVVPCYNMRLKLRCCILYARSMWVNNLIIIFETIKYSRIKKDIWRKADIICRNNSNFHYFALSINYIETY